MGMTHGKTGLDFGGNPDHDPYPRTFKGFFIYSCNSYRQEKIKDENRRLKFEFSECFLVTVCHWHNRSYYLLCYCLCSVEEFRFRFSNGSHQQILHLGSISWTECRALDDTVLNTFTLCRTFDVLRAFASFSTLVRSLHFCLDSRRWQQFAGLLPSLLGGQLQCRMLPCFLAR